jgi:dihydroxyacetone kinase
MAGFQLTFARADAETKRLWDAPADSPYFKITGA